MNLDYENQIATVFSRVSEELVILSSDLRRSEDAIHRALTQLDWANFSQEVADIQAIDRAIQSVDALDAFLSALSKQPVECLDVKGAAAVVSLATLRARLSGEQPDSARVAPQTVDEIDLF